jgi:hypothetical protein
MAEEAFEELEPELGDTAVQLVVEVQLHLDFFFQQRKKTHLWFKVLRAATLQNLNLDCCAYRDATDPESGDGASDDGDATRQSRDSSEGWEDVDEDDDGD